MAKSKETFNKRQKEKNRLKLQQEKREKMEERKANAKKGRPLEEMLAYIDENGNLSSTPPDPKVRKLSTLKDAPEENEKINFRAEARASR